LSGTDGSSCAKAWESVSMRLGLGGSGSCTREAPNGWPRIRIDISKSSSIGASEAFRLFAAGLSIRQVTSRQKKHKGSRWSFRVYGSFVVRGMYYSPWYFQKHQILAVLSAYQIDQLKACSAWTKSWYRALDRYHNYPTSYLFPARQCPRQEFRTADLVPADY